MFKPLKKQRIKPSKNSPSLTDQIYDRLVDAIMRDELSGETRLIAGSLAQQLGVSITPVRESLLRLCSQNLVKAVPRVGYIVETMSAADVIDLFEARIGMERLLARMAFEKISPAEIDVLEKNVDEMKEALRTGKTEGLEELDRTFHLLIARAARNKTLFSLHELLIQRSYRYRHACLLVKKLAEVTRDGHEGIVNAFKAKDAEKVDLAVRTHLENVKDSIAAYLEQLRHDTIGLRQMDL